MRERASHSLLALILLAGLFWHEPSTVLALGQDPAGLADRGLVARRQALLDLANPFTVMCVACHPDDEDGPTLTVERREYGARTVTLFATSGEGGQNAVGPELYDELGRIRERETVEASEVQGSTPYFLRLRDFGFSKTGDEAMRIWEAQAGSHELLLGRWVRALRELRPNVVITNHDTTTGHGQHQATGRLIVEAVAAAADASRFPDAGAPWTVASLLVRTRGAAAGAIAIDASAYDPIRGLTYREIAFRALLRHATQGPWEFDFIPPSAWYVPTAPVTGAPSGIGSPLTAAIPLPPNALLVDRAAIDGDPVALRTRLVNLSKQGGLSVSDRRRVDAALAALSGVDVTLTIATASASVGDQVPSTLTIANSGDTPLTVAKLQFPRYLVRREMEPPAEAWLDAPIAPHSVRKFVMPLNVVGTTSTPAATFPPSDPPPPSAVRAGPNAATGFFGVGLDIVAGDASFNVSRLEYVEVTSPLRLSVSIGRTSVVLRALNASARPLTVCEVRVGGRRDARTDHLAPGAETAIALPADYGGGASVVACLDDDVHADNCVSATTVSRLSTNVRVAPGLRVGYFRSYDYTLPEALERLGVANRELTVADVRDGDLSRFDTIVVDNRAYLKYPELVRYNARLLDYVQRGGNLIVFYHKRGEYQAGLAPYPITLGTDRITDEHAPVEILKPRNPIFTTPNPITLADFEGWVQERGLYFPSEWDPRYDALLSSHDPGEKPLTGGLLVAPYGRGTFIYTSYVWYRQLRGLVPGGYRMFANMISYHAGRRLR